MKIIYSIFQKEIHKQSHSLNDKESIAKVNGDFLIWLGKEKI